MKYLYINIYIYMGVDAIPLSFVRLIAVWGDEIVSRSGKLVYEVDNDGEDK